MNPCNASTNGALDRVEQRLKITWKDRSLLLRALTHPSYIYEDGNDPSRFGPEQPRSYSYERLEFLGDRIINLAVALMVYRALPTADEGVLTRQSMRLTATKPLALAAEDLELAAHIRLGVSTRESFHLRRSLRERILAGVFEAVVGALYCDQGSRQTTRFLRRVLLKTAANNNQQDPGLDPKNLLQRLAQQRHRQLPVYKDLGRSGTEHNPLYAVGVFIDGELLGQGIGDRRQVATVRAAIEALQRLEEQEKQ